MVKVNVNSKDGIIVRVNVYDHAGYAESGQDLVCAAVSSITFGMMNALEELVPGSCNYEINEASVIIKHDTFNEVANHLLESMIIQLLTIEENYQSYIHITRTEV